MYEVIGFTSTGIYAEVVTAASEKEALRIGKPLVCALNTTPRKILRWEVRPW